jgi:hypothetical protein
MIFFISKNPIVRVTMWWLLQGKHLPETLVKIWARSNDQIKSYGPFELLVWSSVTKLPFRPRLVPLGHKYIC